MQALWKSSVERGGGGGEEGGVRGGGNACILGSFIFFES